MEEQPNLTQSFSLSDSPNRYEEEPATPSSPTLNRNGSSKAAKTYQVDQDALTRYKTVLQKRVVWSLILLFVVISERIFAAYTQRYEHDIIVSWQKFFGITYDTPNKFLEPVMFLENNLYFVLLLTHYFIIIYYFYNAVTCLKLICVTFNAAVLITMLEMIFEDGRPYWQDNRIFAAECLNSFGFPSFTLFCLIFLFLYSQYCFKDSQDEDDESWKIVDVLKAGLFIIVVGIYCFARVVAGTEYISQAVLTVLYSVFIYYCSTFFDKTISSFIEKSSIDVQNAKRNCIYWMVYLLIAAGVVTITYENCSTFVNIDWFSNYFNCMEMTDQTQALQVTPYYHLLGAWGAFLKTGVLFVMMGAVFGCAITFREFKGAAWNDSTSRKNKLIMTLIASLFMIPSWLVMYFQQSFVIPLQQNQFNMYISNAFHFGVLYFVLFGILPKQIFDRLGLVDKNSGYAHMVEGELIRIDSNGQEN